MKTEALREKTVTGKGLARVFAPGGALVAVRVSDCSGLPGGNVRFVPAATGRPVIVRQEQATVLPGRVMIPRWLHRKIFGGENNG